MGAQGGAMTHRTARIALVLSLSTALGCGGATAPEPGEPAPSPAGSPPAVAVPVVDLPDPPGYSLTRTGDVHDFDFLAGAWDLTNRRLKARGAGSSDWDEFPATVCATVFLGGVANADEIQFPTKGWGGVTLRTFDTAKKQWSIYWVNSRTGVMYAPVVGGFDGDVGEFFGPDLDDGRPVKVRFRWTKRGPDRASWEQAFSYDGITWETNWRNELTRVDASRCTW
jgi:hypothetical protein